MHTFEHAGSTLFGHDGFDIKGRMVLIEVRGHALNVPGSALIAFIAAYVAHQRITALEQADDAEILGLPEGHT